MKLTIVVNNENPDEISGNLEFEGEGESSEMVSLVMAAADLLQWEWTQGGFQEFWSFNEMLTDVRKARK